MSSVVLAKAVLIGVLTVASPASYVLTSSVTLTSPSPQLRGYFGDSVAISGSSVVVGAWNETVGGLVGAGRVYVFSANTGALLLTLTNPNNQAEGHFGYSVAISGSRMVVGAWNETVGGLVGAGLAYIFDANTGALLFTLISRYAQANGAFGIQVAISGSKAVVSSNEGVWGHAHAGRVYVFNANTGALHLMLTSPNAQVNGGFGSSALAVSGNKVVVGAAGENVSEYAYAGHAYVFNARTGALLLTLTSPNAQTNGAFGSSVAIAGNKFAVGAPQETVSGNDSVGRAYVFNVKSGALLLTLTSSNAQYGDLGHHFGWSVSFSGNRVAVGAVAETANGLDHAGHAYIFSARTGALLLELTSPNAQAQGQFGASVAITGNVLVVGAPLETVGAVGAGHAYVFKFGEG